MVGATDKQRLTNQLFLYEKQQQVQLQQQQQLLQEDQQNHQQQVHMHLLGGKAPVGGGTLFGNLGTPSLGGSGSPTVAAEAGSLTFKPSAASLTRQTTTVAAKSNAQLKGQTSTISAVSLAMAAGKQPPPSTTGPSLLSSATAIAAMAQAALYHATAAATANSFGIGAVATARPHADSSTAAVRQRASDSAYDPDAAPPAYTSPAGSQKSRLLQQQQSLPSLTSPAVDRGNFHANASPGSLSRTSSLASSSQPAKDIGTAEGWQRHFGHRSSTAAAAAGATQGHSGGRSGSSAAAAASSSQEHEQQGSGDSGGKAEAAAGAGGLLGSQEHESGGGNTKGRAGSESNAADVVSVMPGYGVGVGYPLRVTAGQAGLQTGTGAGRTDDHYAGSLRDVAEGSELGGAFAGPEAHVVGACGVAVVSAADFADGR